MMTPGSYTSAQPAICRPDGDASEEEYGSGLSPLQRAVRRFIVGRWFNSALVLFIALLTLVQGVSVWDSYVHTVDHTEQSAGNVRSILRLTIERRLKLVDATLQNMLLGLQIKDFEQLDPRLSRSILFNRADDADYVGALLVVDGNGRIRHDSQSEVPRSVDLHDREYIGAHRQGRVGVFVSHPFVSRLRPGDWSISLSRRIDGPDGNFDGVVSASISLDFFTDIFRTVKLNSRDSLALIMADGSVIARRTGTQEQIPYENLRKPDIFRMQMKDEGTFEAVSPIDQVKRYYVYARLEGFPLYLLVGIDQSAALSDWVLQSVVNSLVELLLAVAAVVGFMGLRRMLVASYEMEQHLHLASVTDPLTGLANRRALQDSVDRAWRAALRSREPLSLIVMDCDRFKRVNDSLGHAAGDAALRMVAGVLSRVTRRPYDRAARFGGEEFAILLPNTQLADAVELAEEIRARVRNEDVRAPGGTTFSLTVSLGVAMTYPFLEADRESLFRRADLALYYSKHSGRDRTSRDDMLPDGFGEDR